MIWSYFGNQNSILGSVVPLAMFFYNFWFPESLERLPMFRKVFHQLEKTIYIFLCCYDCHHLKLKGFLSPSLQGNIQAVWVKQTGRGGGRAWEEEEQGRLSATLLLCCRPTLVLAGKKSAGAARVVCCQPLSQGEAGRSSRLASSHTKDNLLWKQNRQWRHDAKVKLPSVWKAVQDELELIKVD